MSQIICFFPNIVVLQLVVRPQRPTHRPQIFGPQKRKMLRAHPRLQHCHDVLHLAFAYDECDAGITLIACMRIDLCDGCACDAIS